MNAIELHWELIKRERHTKRYQEIETGISVNKCIKFFQVKMYIISPMKKNHLK